RTLGPLLVVAGALIVLVAALHSMAPALHAWFMGESPWPQGMLLDALVAASAPLLAAAVLMTRRSILRTEAAEKALREGEERMRLVADNVPALISYLDREQRFRFGNRTYDEWLGIPHEELYGRGIAEVFGEEAYGGMRAHIESVLRGEPVQFELAL